MIDVKGAWELQLLVAVFSTCAVTKHKSQRVGGQEEQPVVSPQGASLGLSSMDLKYSGKGLK